MSRFGMGMALVIALAFAPLDARAQDAAVPAEAEDARTLFQRGQTAYAQADYEGAIAQWSRAYELDARPLLQFNLSQAYERLGRLEESIAALELYLAQADPDDVHQADARARLGALRERLGRTGVRIVGGPEGATILIDDTDRGRTPRPDAIQVAPGSHRIVVRAPGYQDFNSTIVVSAGQAAEVPVEMTPVAAVATTSGDELPVVPIILFSVGGAALIAGGVMGGIALSDAQSAPGSTSPEAESARGLALGADITMAIGAAAAVAGLVVLLVSGSDDGEEAAPERISLAPWGGATGAGVTLQGSF